VTQHDCLPRLLGDGEKLIEIVKSEKKKKYFLPGRLEQPRQDKNLLYQHEEPNEPTKDPFHLYSSSPHSAQFQLSAGPLATPFLVSLLKTTGVG
jgi:hypothetical protein